MPIYVICHYSLPAFGVESLKPCCSCSMNSFVLGKEQDKNRVMSLDMTVVLSYTLESVAHQVQRLSKDDNWKINFLHLKHIRWVIKAYYSSLIFIFSSLIFYDSRLDIYIWDNSPLFFHNWIGSLTPLMTKNFETNKGKCYDLPPNSIFSNVVVPLRSHSTAKGSPRRHSNHKIVWNLQNSPIKLVFCPSDEWD